MNVPRLFVLTPGTLAGEDWRRFVERASGLAGLELALVLREPGLFDGAFLELARELGPRLGTTPLVLHDRPHLVAAAGAAGVHLGFRSLRPETVRPLTSGWVGLSTHAPDDRSTWRPADYLFHGPLRETASKRGLLQPVGLDGLASAVESASAPVLALGGVTPEDVGPALAAGAHGVAVLGGIWNGERAVVDAAAGYLDALARSVA